MRLCWLLVLLLASGELGAADLTLEFEPRFAGKPITIPSDNLSNGQAQVLRITRLAALISNVTLTRRGDGASVTLPGQYGFVDAGNDRLAVAFRDVPAGDYTGVAFDFGLPPVANHADPGQWPAGHALNPLVNHLHWNWKGGYVFVALEGHWGNANREDDDHGFSYHLAGDEHTIPIRFQALFTVTDATRVRFAIDLAKPLVGRRLDVGDGSESTHSADGDTLAVDLANALQRSVFCLGSDAHGDATPSPPSVVGGVASPRDGTVASGSRPREGCTPPTSNPPTKSRAHPLAFTVPAGFPAPNLPADNPLTEEGVALGRALFTDKRLSREGRQSCADCHHADQAFSDRRRFSFGADGEPGVRNAMPLFNLAWAPSYAWDGGKPHVRDQALAAMTNPTEMHADPAVVVAALRRDKTLAPKFAAAFGSPEITIERICLALEQYLLTIVSADSRFDRAVAGHGELTEQEKEGFALFMTEFDPARGRRGADCFHCHGGPLFTDYDFKNNGLDRKFSGATRATISHRPEDAGKFRTPSLRNVAVTGPYMHDGRFATLADVIAHYDHGVSRSPTLDPNLAKHPNDGLKLTDDEQKALIAFLQTLTDERWEKRTAGSM